ncbi:MAG TPA: hypothetical protein VF834_14555 [Streptosporangiaceae bacterium]
MRLAVIAAYAMPGAAVWLVLGLVLAAGLHAIGLTAGALAAAVVYAGYYGVVEALGWPGLPPPGRRWQVPQTMLIGAAPARRVLVWGAILGPGFWTRNPYAGFGLLPVAVAAMPGPVPGLALGAAIGAAHGAARAVALLRDVRDLRETPAMAMSPAPGAGSAASALTSGEGVATHLDLLLKTVYWRRLDGVVLLAVAAAAALASVRSLT